MARCNCMRAYSRLYVLGASKESGPESDECNERSPRSRQRGRSPELFSLFLPPSLLLPPRRRPRAATRRGVPSRACTASFIVNKIRSFRLMENRWKKSIALAIALPPKNAMVAKLNILLASSAIFPRQILLVFRSNMILSSNIKLYLFSIYIFKWNFRYKKLPCSMLLQVQVLHCAEFFFCANVIFIFIFWKSYPGWFLRAIVSRDTCASGLSKYIYNNIRDTF